MSPEPKEFEHTNSASRPVLWACVGSFGRISYSVTRAPRVAACQAASDPAKPPPMTTTSSRICLNLHRIRIVRTAFERCQADSRIPDPSLTDLIRHVRLACSRGRLAQRKSASLTRKRPLVRYQYRPPYRTWRDRSARLIRQQAVARQLYPQATKLYAEIRCRVARRRFTAVVATAGRYVWRGTATK